jgi:hypothetical protein
MSEQEDKNNVIDFTASQRPLAVKMAEILGEVGNVPKNGRNDFHGYDYIQESDLVDHLRSKLAKAGIAIFPSIREHVVTQVQDARSRIQYMATVTLDVTFIDGDTGDKMTTTWVGQGVDAGDKSYYKAYTGAFKYALLKTFMVSTGDDPELDQIPAPKSIALGQSAEEKAAHRDALLLTQLVDEVKRLVGDEKRKAWQRAFIDRLGLGDGADMFDVEPAALRKAYGYITHHDEDEKRRERVLKILEESAPANEDTPVEEKGKQLAAKSEAARKQRLEDKREDRQGEFFGLLNEAVGEAQADRFAVLYVARMTETRGGKDHYTIADIEVQKIAAMCRKLKGMNVETRANYIEHVIADQTGEIDQADEAEIDAALEEQDNERWLEANKTWWAAANEPFLRGVADLEEKQAKQLRKEAKVITEKFRAMQLDSWGVASSRELTLEEYEQKAQRLADIPVDAREEFIRDIIAKAD